jgi:preprotein translocase subunit SecG
MLIAIEVIVCLIVVGLVVLTVALNTKSEGLGAAITGASDSYRGAVGAEEQKRNLLKTLGYSFMILAFIHAIVARYF